MASSHYPGDLLVTQNVINRVTPYAYGQSYECVEAARILQLKN